jgi:hypothetical protein
MVRTQAASLLGYPGPEAVQPERPFNEVGFDSLSAVGFRNKLTMATGMRLPATMIFDYPDSLALARYIGSVLAPEAEESTTLQPTDAQVRELLQRIPLSRLRDAGLLDNLLELAGVDHEQAVAGSDDGTDDSIDDMDTDALISMALQDTEHTDVTKEM